MKFWDKLNLRRFTKVTAVVAISGSLFLSGNAVVNAAPMRSFMTAEKRLSNRIFAKDAEDVSAPVRLMP